MNPPLLPEERHPQPSGPCPKQQAWWESCDPREKAVIEWYGSTFPLDLAYVRMNRLSEFLRLVLGIQVLPKRTEQHILVYERFPEFKAFCIGKGSASVKKS